MVDLGDKAKDIISGFTGIVNSKTCWLNGCVRVGIAPEELDKDGKLRPSEVFDESQIVLVKKSKIETGFETPKDQSVGGPDRGEQKSSVG